MRSEMCFSLERIAFKKANTHGILVTLTQVQTIFTPSAGLQSTIMSWILIGTFFVCDWNNKAWIYANLYNRQYAKCTNKAYRSIKQHYDLKESRNIFECQFAIPTLMRLVLYRQWSLSTNASEQFQKSKAWHILHILLHMDMSTGFQMWEIESERWQCDSLS